MIACLIGSIARARAEGVARIELPSWMIGYDLSQRIAALGRDEAVVKATQELFARFGW